MRKQKDKPFSPNIITYSTVYRSINIIIYTYAFTTHILHSSLKSTSTCVLSRDSHNPSQTGRANISVLTVENSDPYTPISTLNYNPV